MKIPAQNLLSKLGISFSVAIIASLLLLFSFYLLSSPATSNAQGLTLDDVNNEVYTEEAYSNVNPNVTKSSQNGIQILFIEFASTIHCQLAGSDPLNKDGRCLGIDKESGKIGYVENGGGLIVGMGKLIDATFVPPASSLQYIAYLKDSFGISKKTYAQTDTNSLGTSYCHNTQVRGIGFCQIEFLLPIWKVMRNIVYLLFIIVFIIIGIGIMLRIHIDPRTVMTIQNQIPKIIIGIIAITFSFAIAGFLIDIMWVAVYLFTSVITSATPASYDPSYAEITQSTNPFNAANNIWPAAIEDGGGSTDFGIYDVAVNTGSAFSSVIVDALDNLANIGFLWDILEGFIAVLASIIVFIAILIALIRLWVKLILALVSVILDIILAPWWILGGLIPGSSLGVGVWLRDLIANLAVFPVTIAFLLLAGFIMSALLNQDEAYRTTVSLPLLGGTNATSLAALIGFGFLMFIPGLIDSLKELVKAPKGGFGNIFGPVGSAVGYTRNVASTTAETYATRNEATMKNIGNNKYDWKPKGIGGGLKQRLFR